MRLHSKRMEGHMQEEERQANEGQSEAELPPAPESGPGLSSHEAEEPPRAESEAEQGQNEEQSSPPPAAPIPLPLTARQKRRQYFLGLAFGLIPLIVFLVLIGLYQVRPGLNALGYLILAGLLGSVLYAIELIVTIVYFSNKQRRFVGYGLLTAFLASPVIAFIGCTVIPNLIHP